MPNMNNRYACMVPMVVLLCLSVACAQPGKADGQPDQPVVLFDGETLDGWKPVDPAEAHFWSVADSLLTGGDGMSNVPKNTYLQRSEEHTSELQSLMRIAYA